MGVWDEVWADKNSGERRIEKIVEKRAFMFEWLKIKTKYRNLTVERAEFGAKFANLN